MQIKQRIRKLERQTGVNDKFCRCGTPYYVTFVIGGENITQNICRECGRDVKPQTRAEFVIESQRNNYINKVIEPRAEYTREEFEAHQNEHVMSRHRSYKEFLAEQNAGR